MFQAKWFRAVLVMAVLASLIVAPLVVSAAETNGITAPADGAKVSGEVTVTAYAAGDDFKKWDLFLLPGGDDSAKAWLASGDTQGEISVPLDTAKYPDGDHVLSLRVVRNDSNYTEYTSKVTFANAAAPAPVETPAPAATADRDRHRGLHCDDPRRCRCGTRRCRSGQRLHQRQGRRQGQRHRCGRRLRRRTRFR